MLIYIFIIFYRFAKNLDPNSLSLKFFKGEGELTNLELEEGLISELLELSVVTVEQSYVQQNICKGWILSNLCRYSVARNFAQL